jgi:putrescine importer
MMAFTARRSAAAAGPGRTLKVHHLILYRIIIIQPTASMSIYGEVSNTARGHVVTRILIAMLFTAVIASACWASAVSTDKTRLTKAVV